MTSKITYDTNQYYVLSEAYDAIPKIKGGKSDVKAFVAYVQDINMYDLFKRKYLGSWNTTKKERVILIQLWNEYISKRESEDYITFDESENKVWYLTIFK